MNEEQKENNLETLRDIISEANLAIDSIENDVEKEIDFIQQCFMEIESKVQDLRI